MKGREGLTEERGAHLAGPGHHLALGVVLEASGRERVTLRGTHLPRVTQSVKQQSKIKGLPASPPQGWKPSQRGSPRRTPREPARPCVSITLVFGAQWNHLTMDRKDHSGSLLGLGTKEGSRVYPGGVLNCSVSPTDPRPRSLACLTHFTNFPSRKWTGTSAGQRPGLVKPLILQMRLIPWVTQSTFVKEMKILELFKNGPKFGKILPEKCFNMKIPTALLIYFNLVLFAIGGLPGRNLRGHLLPLRGKNTLLRG